MSLSKKYSDFLLMRLFESVLVTSREFKQIINDMPNTDKIADILYSIIDERTDIKTNYNLVDIQKDKNDEISFLPDTQYQRFITKGEDVSTKTKSNSKIGRMIGQILRDNGHTKFTDSDIEKFVNSFKSQWNKKHGIINRKTEVVKGDQILKWYNSKNYNSDKGTLGSSCMRYDKVNHFMNIYAKNPDKISMVIITEEGKLVARALFWVLDETTAGSSKKFYLDRIYTEQDSDFQFVYDWVVENLCANDPKILTSHKNGDNQYEMKVFLKNTKFDHYPYADTFNYLYERLNKDGQVTGSGFVSNLYDESMAEQTKDGQSFLISEIRNHSEGTPSNLSHVYSEYFDSYILKSEAVKDHRLGWIPKSKCKRCEFDGEWIYEENAIWSDAMQDWIHKDFARDSDFGVVHKDAVKKVATKYIGKYTNPIDFINGLGKGEELFEIKDMIKSSSSEFEIPENRYGGPRYYIKELLVKDIWGDYQVKQSSFELHECDDVELTKKVEFSNLIIRSKFMMLDDAVLFDVNYTDTTIWIGFSDLKDFYDQAYYTKFMEFLKSSNIDESTKKRISEVKTKFHEYWLAESSAYRTAFNLQEKMKNVTPEEVVLELYESVCSKLAKKGFFEKFTLGGVIEALENEYYDYMSMSPENKDEVIKFSLKLIEVMILPYLITSDSYDSKIELQKWCSNSPSIRSEMSKITLDIAQLKDRYFSYLRSVFREFLNEIRIEKREGLEELSRNYSLTSRELEMFISKINLEKMSPFK